MKIILIIFGTENFWHDNWLNLQGNMRRTIVIHAFLILSCIVRAQDTVVTHSDTSASAFFLLKTATYDGQTYPLVELKEVTVYGEMPKNVKFNYRRHARLVYNVRKVYPYSVMVRNELGRVNRLLETLPNERDRRNFLQQYEKDIFNTYEDDMKQLTFTQGKILIKLIYRETGNSTYDIVRELRGNFTAFIWQTMAGLFGYDLKTTYDPENDEDKMIEQIVLMIDAGLL